MKTRRKAQGRRRKKVPEVWPPHPAADIFPMLGETEMEELIASISARGQRKPITLYRGKILDGRCRFRACQMAGIKPRFETFRGKDPIGFVIDQNLMRRHLTPAQRAMAAAELATISHGGDRRSDDFKSPAGDLNQAAAAEKLSVGKRSVERAAFARNNAEPAIATAVRRGALSLSGGVALAKLPASEQKELASADAMCSRALELRRGDTPNSLKTVVTDPADAPPSFRVVESPTEFDALFLRNCILKLVDQIRDGEELRILLSKLAKSESPPVRNINLASDEARLALFLRRARRAHNAGTVAQAKQSAIDALLQRQDGHLASLRKIEVALNFLREESGARMIGAVDSATRDEPPPRH